MARILQLSLQLIRAAGFALALGSTLAVAQTMQQHIHEMGHTVMPFDLTKTTHIFRMTDSGGVQSVVVKDAQDKDQIGPIRRHLQHEAEAFQRGDYADPMSLHGTAMPGLSELASHHAEITVSYSELPLGAALTFTTRDQHLVTAIHRWFGAQLSEHGADARPE
jgi:imidazoleglycerol phosphate dehydratase HisB